MESKTAWVAGISGAVGGAVGSVSGSNNIFVTLCVGVVIALFVAWGIGGFFK